ncbi:MAG: protein tyrosine phosphatase [Mesorhizobium sp.]|nr:protein tyrosine phosphatase [Mesorhizobium sp.]MBN9243774.1 protein tyrosine phosphatase [Mesorhizobium sp.]MBN9270172.1 protein tyrosine phosphatase [Mesorhizobium sp.]
MNDTAAARIWNPARVLRVSALFAGRVHADVADYRPTHVVSLLDPAIDPAKVPAFGETRTLQRRFNDGDAPTAFPLTTDLMREIVGFLEDWSERLKAGGDARLLVHCHMGASRSTAVALVALAVAHGESREAVAFADLLRITNKPWPNIHVVRLGDAILRRGGALIAELERYREANPNRLAAYRRLNNRRGLA